jgi:hypothetical protein
MPTLSLAWYESLTCEVIAADFVPRDPDKSWLPLPMAPDRITAGLNGLKPTPDQAGRVVPGTF